MRRSLVLVLLLFVGCTAYQPPSDHVSVTIRDGTMQTMTAMALPPERQPKGRILDDQIRLLACRLSPERVQLLDSGALGRDAIVDAYGDALKRRAARKSTIQAPTMLVFLVEKQPTWSAQQTMLAAALLAQFEDEAHLKLEKVDLPQ